MNVLRAVLQSLLELLRRTFDCAVHRLQNALDLILRHTGALQLLASGFDDFFHVVAIKRVRLSVRPDHDSLSVENSTWQLALHLFELLL